MFASVSIDTRSLQPGALYVALRGANFDGHRFVSQAVAAGARGVVVERSFDASALPADITVLQVADTLLALQQMGHAARQTLSGPLIAVTGSNGKTSTRQLIASVLSAHYGAGAVLATEGNLNNHIGVPLTLLRLRPTHAAAVIELGMNHFHELELLSSLAQPDIAVITNAGPAHLEGVGSLAGVAEAKAEVFVGMRAQGMAVLNADDHFLPYWEVVNRSRRILRFGMSDRADVRGRYDAAANTLTLDDVATPMSLAFAGEHNARNALAAVAVARALNIPEAGQRQGLATATNIGGRLTRKTLAPNVEAIDDSYNANPASVRAGLQVLLREPGRTVMVLGDMAELGDESPKLHVELLRDIAASAVTHVFTLGVRTAVAASALAAEIPASRIRAFEQIDKLVNQLQCEIAASSAPLTLLVKGAHSMAMHRVIDRLASGTGENP
ncbi:MAG: UDP-N-acetylmuramoyl-tripeptide--D-alanyl-D-alanine ligase [Burkholderiales bacterium]|nr:UDP-N-acetylmuramoyl-tripeptide--D-alanyl-D-alanine ligase [Burkholderiales bacterium]